MGAAQTGMCAAELKRVWVAIVVMDGGVDGVGERAIASKRSTGCVADGTSWYRNHRHTSLVGPTSSGAGSLDWLGRAGVGVVEEAAAAMGGSCIDGGTAHAGGGPQSLLTFFRSSMYGAACMYLLFDDSCIRRMAVARSCPPEKTIKPAGTRVEGVGGGGGREAG